MIGSGVFRKWCLWIALSILTGLAAGGNPPADHKNQSVLCISSYSADSQWINDILFGLRSYLQQGNQPVAFELFELDVNLQPAARPRPEDVARLQQRLDLHPYQALIVLGDPALELVRRRELRLPEQLPMVFGDCRLAGAALCRSLPANMTGVVMPPGNLNNLRLGVELFPATREVVVLSNAAEDGSKLLEELSARQAELGYDGKITVLSGAEYDSAALLAYLAHLPADSLVIYNDWFAAGEENPLSRNRLQYELQKAAAHLPVFAACDEIPASLEWGIGGVMVSGRKMGGQLGELLLQILNGRNPAELPPETAATEVNFDYRELQRFGIPHEVLPPGAILHHVPPSFADAHANWLLLSSIILGLLVALGVVGWLIRRRYARRMRAIFEALPARIVVVDDSGRLRFSCAGAHDSYREKLLDLKRFSPLEYEGLWSCAQRVFADGKPHAVDYADQDGRRRKAEVRKLPAAAFGRDAAIWVSLDVEELHRLRLDHQQMAEQLSLTLEAIGDGVIVTDPEERVVLLNKVAGELTGYSAAAGIGRPLDEIFQIVSHPDRAPAPSPLRQALEQRRIVMLAEHTDLIARDGTRRHIADSAAPIINAEGVLTGGVLVFRDVSVEYERLARLHIQNAVLEKALEAGRMTFFRCDQRQQFIQAPPEQLWPCRDGVPLPVSEWMQEEDAEGFRHQWEALFRGSIREFYGSYRVQHDGQWRYYEIRMFEEISPVSGRKEFFGIIQDMTSFRERELNYRNTSALLHNVIDNMPGYVWVKDAENDRRHLLVSRNIGDLVGRDAEKLVGCLDTDFLEPEAEAAFRQADLATLRDGRCEMRVALADTAGSVHDLKVSQTLLTRPAGGRLLLGIGVDITRELKMERQLQEKNRLLEDILDNLPIPLFIKDFYDEGRYLLASRTFISMFGLDEKMLFGHTDFEVMPTEAARKFVEDDTDTMFRETPQVVFEDVTLPNGRVAKFQTWKVKLRRSSGNDLLLGVGIDITELTENRNELKQSNNLLRAIMDNLPCSLFVKDADHDFRYLMFNRAFAEAFSLVGREVIGHCDPELLLPENARSCGESDRATLTMGTTDTEEEVKFEDGSRHMLRSIKSIVTHEDGRKLLLGICLDVTPERQLSRERQRLIEELQAYGDQQRALNDALKELLLSNDFASAIDKVLLLIGEQVQADRCYIFYRDQGENFYRNIFEWTAPGVAPEIDTLQHLPSELMPAWVNALENHEIIFSADLERDAYNPAILEGRKELRRQNVKSILATGIWSDDRLWGFLGFDYVKERVAFPEITQKMLIAAARIIEIALLRQLRQQDLERSEYEKKLIMDTIKTPIILYDKNMKLLRANHAAERVSLLPFDQVAPDTPCYKFFCGEEHCPEYCPVRQTLDDWVEHSCEMHIRDRDYLITANPILLDGQLDYVLKTMLDITDFNLIEQKLKQAVLDAQNASKAKSYFLATMSHELRTPLNAVIGFSELLRNNTLPLQEQNEYLQSINLAGNALLTLINDILDLSKLEAGQAPIVPEKCDFLALCREIHAIFKLQAAEKKLAFKLEAPETLPALYLDSQRLRQVLLNLIGNALKFTERGTVRLCINFLPEEGRQGTLTIRVIDTGIGISEKGQRTIFEPFVQDSEVRGSHAYQGTGLGLTISSRLIDQMGGKITLESEVGKGSCFTVTLRRVRSEVMALPAPPETEAHAAEVPAEVAGTERPLAILLVDDVPMNLKVLEAMLKKLGIVTCCAASGAEALQCLEHFEPDLVMTDMWMPAMNGVELAEKIRKNAPKEELMIVAVTADTESRANFGMDLFDAVVLKPLTLEKLQKLIAYYRQDSRPPGGIEL
ncbi:PAS domain-containing protein [Victivallis sp. Marseille-Q1083]|uniref:PAS domain-containing protein n=1 Tax=Victivallis sp. Marseille-Q1083 TaxID=2717288 RepID=UPI00158BDC7B|nr:PAS domain-containing protein [Victivallis sp. Marseille-Q1083]